MTDEPAGTPAPMPDFVPPMTATLAERAFSDPDWLFEVKWDGYRVQAVVRDGRVRLWTRNRADAARYFPDLAGPPDWIEAREAIVDGEVVALDEAGRPSFSLLQARAGFGQRRDAGVPIVYQAFDLLHLDGRSLLDVPLEERKRLLRERLRDHPLVRYAGHVEGDGEALFETAKAQGLEGVMAKRRSSRYEPGRRSHAWLKVKVRREQEFVVGGWEPSSVAQRDLGALLLGVHDPAGDLRFAGEVGSGMDARTRHDLLARLRELERDDPPFADPPRLKAVHWVEPRLVVRVEFAEWTREDAHPPGGVQGPRADETRARSGARSRPPTPASIPTPEPSTPQAPAQAATAQELQAAPSTPSGPTAPGRSGATSSSSRTSTRSSSPRAASPSATWSATT